ncbi:receptor L domain protein [Ancylostoma caninum]|uniref:Receptor L domain protein n=1 Tax=Ancylostoma caninum TaxID=29170 RepID=A0A368F1X4_ANCCA|nr:receptor L domain protein [Ancylostoma caninum]
MQGKDITYDLTYIPEKICMGGIVTPGYISSTIADHHCDIIRGDVIVQNWRGDATPLQHLMTITKIKGVLHVMDNEELKDLSFFSGLKEIDSGSEEQRAALIISNNSALKELLLVSLTRVESPASATVVMKNNPKLVVEKEELYECFEKEQSAREYGSSVLRG